MPESSPLPSNGHGAKPVTALFAILTCLFAFLFLLAGALYLNSRNELQSAEHESDELEKQLTGVQERATSALARYKGIADLEAYKADLDAKVHAERALLPKFKSLVEMENHRSQLTKSVADLRSAEADLHGQVSAHKSTLARLKAEAEAVEDQLQMQSFGFYRPKYGFENSERYVHQIADVRDRQKAMVKSDVATECPTEWAVDGSTAKGRKMIKEHSQLMLRAFNGECDAAVGQVKYNNVNKLEARIKRSQELINKTGVSNKLWITQGYLQLKLEELYLVHEHREKVEEEREEQRRIKEQMREEEKALREIENAKKQAEADEANKSKALEKAKEELSEAEGKQADRLKAIVDKLETELRDALARKAKAIARAQLTRSGHIYVLSNIGSFGGDVYKIGMTRRLEPLERVYELGDASVPFRYDVHAMIYSEDAPALETTLHRCFNDRRVNMANARREFFRVTLKEIQDAVEANFGVVTFVTVPDAEEYRKTLSMIGSLRQPKEAESIEFAEI
jgi:hypothetical protein